MNLLQSVAFPNLDLALPEEMYVRVNQLAWADLNARCLRFAAAGCAWTDTFYGSFTVNVWKRHCRIATLGMRLEGHGEFVVTFGLNRLGVAPAWLAEQVVTLEAGTAALLPLDAWPTIDSGMLFVRIRSLGGGAITAADWATDDPPPNEVTLGLVITHFNRQAQVLPAIERIRSALLTRADLQGRVTLTVVDNSKNLAVTAGDRIDVIPNANYGGSGGFTRGLLSLMDGGRHTHALFMDDDASCEAESIARTYALLRYAVGPNLAVAGALLREAAPWQLLEKGARFDGMVQPLFSGLDMRKVGDLLEAERPLMQSDYSAWWFFAFPLAAVRRYPFPFFVRGDDIFFGLGNDFEIVTLNGVACIGEDFSAKHGAMTAYLDARYHIVHALLQDTAHPRRRLYDLCRELFFNSLVSYNYASARGVTLAMEHVLEGPQIFRDHIDLSRVRSEIGAWLPQEKLAPIDRSKMKLRSARNRPESTPRRLARILTLHGFLLPRFLLMDRTAVQSKGFHGNPIDVFRHRRVLYEHRPSGAGYVAEHDSRLFFAELRRFLRAASRLTRRARELRLAYRAGYDDMTTLAFWREVYDLPPRTSARQLPTAAAAQGAAAVGTDEPASIIA